MDTRNQPVSGQPTIVKVLVVCAGAFAVLALGFIPVTENVWCLVTGRGFHIPAESSLFTFHATEMNEGSGEWWLYGEDWRSFYGQGAEGPYRVFRREAAKRCPGFNPRDVRTWCATP